MSTLDSLVRDISDLDSRLQAVERLERANQALDQTSTPTFNAINVGAGAGATTGQVVASAGGSFGTLNSLDGIVFSVLMKDGLFRQRSDDTNSLIHLNVRPNSTKSGYISFTEDSVADRWHIGIKGGDGRFWFRQGNPVISTNTTPDLASLNASGDLELLTGGMNVGSGSSSNAAAGNVRLKSTGSAWTDLAYDFGSPAAGSFAIDVHANSTTGTFEVATSGTPRFVFVVGGVAVADITNAGALRVSATQVVSTRKTGWTAATNTKTRTTFDTTLVTLPVLAAHVGALIDDLISHGLIGT